MEELQLLVGQPDLDHLFIDDRLEFGEVPKTVHPSFLHALDPLRHDVTACADSDGAPILPDLRLRAWKISSLLQVVTLRGRQEPAQGGCTDHVMVEAGELGYVVVEGMGEAVLVPNLEAGVAKDHH